MITICSCLVGLVFVIGITKNAYVKKYEENKKIINSLFTTYSALDASEEDDIEEPFEEDIE